jgi:Domain of unknown function (DUF4111)
MEEYLEALVRRLSATLGDALLAAWVVGSGALGDFDAARSDVDLQALSVGRVERARLHALADALSAVPCPVRGLEFVLYARDEAPRFSLNLNTGPGMSHHEGYDADAEERFWFTLDVSIAGEHAVPLVGPHPREVLPALDRAVVADAARASLAWWRGYDASQAVLAACRAWAWGAEGRWLSKGEAAAWAIARVDDPEGVTMALTRRADPSAPAPSDAHVEAVLARAYAALD